MTTFPCQRVSTIHHLPTKPQVQGGPLGTEPGLVVANGRLSLGQMAQTDPRAQVCDRPVSVPLSLPGSQLFVAIHLLIPSQQRSKR